MRMYRSILFAGLVSSIVLILTNFCSILYNYKLFPFNTGSLYFWLFEISLVQVIMFSFSRIAANKFRFKLLVWLVICYICYTFLFITMQIILVKFCLINNQIKPELLIIWVIIYFFNSVFLLVIYGAFMKFDKMFVPVFFCAVVVNFIIIIEGSKYKYMPYLYIIQDILYILIIVKYIPWGMGAKDSIHRQGSGTIR